jgi:hypothetical protein
MSLLVTFCIFACSSVPDATNNRTVNESSPRIFYSIVNGRSSLEPCLKEVVPTFGNDSTCVLVLDVSQTIYSQDNLDGITKDLLKLHSSVDVMYSYSYGFRRACTIYRERRGQ